jgi:hypothetical protein
MRAVMTRDEFVKELQSFLDQIYDAGHGRLSQEVKSSEEW